jgi:hypothetical protein
MTKDGVPSPLPEDPLVPRGFWELRPEAQLLLALARPRPTAGQRSWIQQFLAAHCDELDWGYFLDQACRHAVLPLVGRNLLRLRLRQSEDGRPLVPYRWIYTYAYYGNRNRNLALADEYAGVLRQLNDSGVDYAVRKGPVLLERVYGDPGARRIGDLDLLVRQQDLAALEPGLRDLGYQQGRRADEVEAVVPFERRTQVFWRTNLTNVTLPFVKLAHREDVELFILDICLNLFQARSGIQAEAADFLGRAVPTTLYGEPARMLDPVDQLIDLCVQLHVEATTLYYLEIGKDLTLMKFIDLVEAMRWTPAGGFAELENRVRRYRCGQSVYYALHFAAQLHPAEIPPDLLARFQPADCEFLEEYGALDGQTGRWDRSFPERLFDRQRTRADARSRVPGPRAWI